MTAWVCATCGVQVAPSERPPEVCTICQEERQYVSPHGQQWTTLEAMRLKGYRNSFRQHEPGLVGVGTVPEFAIGQRTLLVRTPEGNILWDCISYLDDITLELIRSIGGIKAVAISHPHYYAAMVEWADAFDCPIYLHARDRQWVMRPSERITFWNGSELRLTEDVRLVHVGGHFAGGTVLLWSSGADGRGALLTGDVLQVVQDPRWVSFMYSFPNVIPLPAQEIARIRSVVEPMEFDRLYGYRFERVIPSDAHAAVLRSADRYVRALTSEFPLDEPLQRDG